MSRESATTAKIIAYLKANPICDSIEDVLLYGSRARGDARPSSDYDVFVVLDENAKENKNTKKNLLKIKADGYSGEILGDVDVDFHFTFGNDWKKSYMSYHKAICREGVSIWT